MLYLALILHDSGRAANLETHSDASAQLADRGYVLVNGRVRLTGSGRELLANAEIRSAYLEGGHE